MKKRFKIKVAGLLIYIIGIIFFVTSFYLNAASYTNLVIDDFENSDPNLNKLGGYADAEITSGWKWLGETAWAAYSGSYGLASAFSNTNSSFSYYYYTIISNSGSYMNFTDKYNNYAIVWMMRNDTALHGPFKLDIMELDAPNYANRAEVEFKNYNSQNPGTNAVTNNTYQEFVIPIADFTNQQAGFDWTKIKTLVFKTVTCQTSQWRMDDLIIIRGVEVSSVYITNTTSANTNHFLNLNDNLKINVLERSNVYGCSGYVVLSNSLTAKKTNISLSEAQVGSDSTYYANFQPTVKGKYFIDTILSNKYAKDSNGYISNNWDDHFYVGVGIKSLDSFVSSDTDETYYVGQQVIFTVIESNGFNDLSGYVRITNANYSTNITLTNFSGGEYRCSWNTTGLSNTNYYCEAVLSGDTNGANDTGVDLTVKLTNTAIKISAIDSSVGSDTDETYLISSRVKFRVQELNNMSGLSGKIIIKSTSANYSNEINLVSIGSGLYECEWDTTGLTASRDYEIESQLGSDLNGYNDSGVDMVIELYQSGEISFFSNNFYQKYEGEAYINVPEGGLKDSEKADIDIEIVSLNTGGKSLYGKIYKFLPENLIFSKPVKIGLPVPSSTGYALYTYNGYEWLKLNSYIQQISGRSYLETEVNTTGIFAVFSSTSTTVEKLTISKRVFSPNNDGINDYINIITPDTTSSLSSIIVYNLKGREIRNLNNNLIWDGRDNNGNKVRSGVYVIKVTIGEKIYYKTVTVINK